MTAILKGKGLPDDDIEWLKGQLGGFDGSIHELNSKINSLMGSDMYKARTERAKAKAASNVNAYNSAEQKDQQIRQAESGSNASALLTAGVSKGNAGLLGSGEAQSNTGNNTQGLYSNARGVSAATQQQYLNAMNSAKNMRQQANNLESASGYNVASGILQGAGTGASLGAGI